jgi:hypothetical protein
MPVAVELNGLLPGRGPGRGGPGTPADGRGAPPGLGAPEPGAPEPGAPEPGAPEPGRGAFGLGAPCGAVPEPSAAGCCALGAVSLAAAGASAWGCGNGTGGLPGDPSAPRSAAGAVAAGLAGSTAAGAGLTSAAGATGAAGLRPLVAPCPSSAAATAGATGAAAERPPAVWLARACLGCWAANASLSLRTTGASIVEDADRTNSPISWSLAMTALLSTPNSLASSYTRTFATALPLLGPDSPDPSAGRGSACSVRRQPLLFIATCSSVAHRNLSLLSRAVSPRPYVHTRPARPARDASHRRPSGDAPAQPTVSAQDTRRRRQSRTFRTGAAPARTPGGAALFQSIPGWDAGMHPGPVSALARQEQSRSRLPPSGASRT